MAWEIETEPEVSEWLEGLSDADFIQSTAIVDRLAEQGNRMRMPFSRSLGDGLFELRYSCGGVNRRISYWFGPKRTIVLLTTFRKQRNNERREVERAKTAMKVCIDRHMSGER